MTPEEEQEVSLREFSRPTEEDAERLRAASEAGRVPRRVQSGRPLCPTHGDRAVTRDEGQGGSGPFGPWRCLFCRYTEAEDST